MTTETPTDAPPNVTKGDWVVYEPREDKLQKPNRYWVARIGREFLVLDAGPVRVSLWDDQYNGPDSGDMISCYVEDVRVVRSLDLARREGAVQALREAAEHFRQGAGSPTAGPSGVAVSMAIAATIDGRADAIEAGEDPS